MNLNITPRKTPAQNIQNIVGKYAEISRFTPLVDVYVVTPVVVSATKAIIEGRIRRYGNAQPSLFHHSARGLSMSANRKNGTAIIVPSRNPLVLKFGVGIQGSRIGNMIRLVTTNASRASAGNIPLIKYSRTIKMAVGNIKWVISTGINIKRSSRLKVTRRISGVAFLFRRYSGISFARTGPYSILNPVRFVTS